MEVANLTFQDCYFVSQNMIGTKCDAVSYVKDGMNRLLLICCVLLAFGCRNDTGETLFQITYPPRDFSLPAGWPPFQSLVIPLGDMNSQYESALNGANVSRDQVDEVSGLFARVSSLSGEDFRQLRKVDLRICPVEQQNGCTEFDILFSLGDLYNRRDVILNLNPGLRNFKELVETGNFQAELVFNFAEISSQSIDFRLEWAIRGVDR